MDCSKLSVAEIMIFERFATADYVFNVRCEIQQPAT